MPRSYLALPLALFLGAGSTLKSTENNLLPNLQLQLTPQQIGDFGAFSFMGEVGGKDLRASGTYGVYFTPCQRFKFSGEFLSQKLEYNFATGPEKPLIPLERLIAQVLGLSFSTHEKKWVSQYALGAEYEYLLSHHFFQSLDIGGAYSHSFSRHAKMGILTKRRIAGSDGGYGYFGTTISPWDCGFLSVDLDYDHVKYHRQFQKEKSARGLGGSLNFEQRFAKNYMLNLTSEFRKPFNFYEAALSWNPSYTKWSFNWGAYVNYTDSKKGVPHVLAAGIQLGFSFGPNKTKCCRTSFEKTPSLKQQECYSSAYCNLSNWVATPAVYMPVVLNTTDIEQSLSLLFTGGGGGSGCVGGVPVSSPIPPESINTPQTIPTGSHFAGTDLMFMAMGLPPGAAIDASGNIVVSSITVFGTYHITIIAMNGCGFAQQPFVLTETM